MFHGRRWRNLSGSNWLSLALYTNNSALCAIVGQFKISFFKDVQNMLFLTQGVVFGSSQCWLGRCGNWRYLGKYLLDYRKEFSSSIVQAFVIIEFDWEFSFQFKNFIDGFDYFASKRFWGFVAAVFQRIDKILTNMSQAPQVSGPVEEIISCIAVSLDVAIKIAQQFLGSLGWSSVTVSKCGNIFFSNFPLVTTQ